MMFQNIQELFERTLAAEAKFNNLVELVEEALNDPTNVVAEKHKKGIRSVYE